MTEKPDSTRQVPLGESGRSSADLALPNRAFRDACAVAMTRMHTDMHRGPWSGDVDRDFLAMMVPHHQGAVDMAALLLRYGRDPLVRRLAEEVIAGQSIEIAAMTNRLDVLESGRTSADEFPALTGVRGHARQR